MRRLAYAIAERLELGLGDRRLDQREDLVLLEPDVVCESRSEVMEQLERRGAAKPGHVASDKDVVEEHADDPGVVGLAVSGIGWEQKLLLEAEVQLLLGVPVVEECPGCLRGGLGGRAAQALGDHECVMVIARAGDEGGMALHGAVGPTAP